KSGFFFCFPPMTSDFDQARTLFLEGIEHFEADRLTDAERCFEASLARLPGRASTLTNLGAVRLRLGQSLAALECLEPVVAAEPDNFEAWAHRAVALGALGRLEDALASDERALALNADSAPVRRHRGSMLQGLGRLGEALAVFTDEVRRNPDDAEAWLHHGEALLAQDRSPEALASFDRSLALDAGQPQAWHRRGAILKYLEQPARAAEAFEQALATGGDPAINGFLLASVSKKPAPPHPPSGYVQSLFDGYAADFERHLVEVLRYQGHTRLLQSLPGDPARRYVSALDLGCGTGLCAPLLRPRVERLTGVDLAPSMVEKSRAGGHYDDVLLADLIEHLATTPQRHDLLVAADVMNYVGDLEPVFRGANRVLEADGLFCFTIERAERDDGGFGLRPSLTYAHTESYLRGLARDHGFEVLEIAEHPVREDRREPVEGLYVYMKRAT
ncbi:MAG: tetratricopeptide repeat protein, partial [Pigmentiphaga sp.]